MASRTGLIPHRPDQLARMPQLTRHAMALAPGPAKLDRSAIQWTPSLDANDVCGDCGEVGLANAARASAALAGFGIDIPTARVLSLYGTQGYRPGPPIVDPGTNLADLLAYQAQNGFDVGGQTPLVADFATFDPQDFNTLRTISARVNAPYLGVNLSQSDMQCAPVWDTDTLASLGDPTPGSEGGHCLIGPWDWTGTEDTDIVRLGTWGFWQRATWRWVRSRIAEAHAVLFRQLQPVEGVDYDRLRADVESFVG